MTCNTCSRVYTEFCMLDGYNLVWSTAFIPINAQQVNTSSKPTIRTVY